MSWITFFFTLLLKSLIQGAEFWFNCFGEFNVMKFRLPPWSSKLPSREWSLLLWFLTPLAELTPKQSLSASYFFFLPRLSNSFMLQPLFWQLFERRIGKRWGFGIKQSWIQNLVFITFLLCFLSREGKIILKVGTRSLGQTARIRILLSRTCWLSKYSYFFLCQFSYL